MTQGTVKGVFHDATTDVIRVQTKQGEREGFLLKMMQRDAAGNITTHEYVMTPSQMQGFCVLVRESLRDQGIEVPTGPGGTPPGDRC